MASSDFADAFAGACADAFADASADTKPHLRADTNSTAHAEPYTETETITSDRVVEVVSGFHKGLPLFDLPLYHNPIEGGL